MCASVWLYSFVCSQEEVAVDEEILVDERVGVEVKVRRRGKPISSISFPELLHNCMPPPLFGLALQALQVEGGVDSFAFMADDLVIDFEVLDLEFDGHNGEGGALDSLAHDSTNEVSVTSWMNHRPIHS